MIIFKITSKKVIVDNAKDRNIKNNEITKELNISIILQSENKINEISESENGNEKKSLNWKKNNKKFLKLKNYLINLKIKLIIYQIS